MGVILYTTSSIQIIKLNPKGDKMFTKPLKEVMEYTRPLVISTRSIDGKVQSSCGTYIILNDEGWIMTAAHILIPMIQFQQHKAEVSKYQEELQKIDNSKLSEKQKKQKTKQLKKNNGWITNISYWWGDDKIKVDGLKHKPNLENDIAIGRIENFEKNSVKCFPKIIDPKKVQTGRSLCKLGFPFPNLNPTFKDGKFNLQNPQITFFPLEGMFTRNIIINNKKSFLESSSPGLRGQSGGPWIDKEGNLWAIQSQTQHIDLEFKAPIKRGNKIVEENQVINLGLGIHPEVIIQFLRDHKVKFEVAP